MEENNTLFNRNCDREELIEEKFINMNNNNVFDFINY